MDFAAELDKVITAAKDAGLSLDDIRWELTCAADGIQGEIDDQPVLEVIAGGGKATLT